MDYNWSCFVKRKKASPISFIRELQHSIFDVFDWRPFTLGVMKMPSLKADRRPTADMKAKSKNNLPPCWSVSHGTGYVVLGTWYMADWPTDRQTYRVQGSWYMADMKAKVQLQSPCTNQYMSRYLYMSPYRYRVQGRCPIWRQNWIEVMKMPSWRHFHHYVGFIGTLKGWPTGGQHDGKLVMKMPWWRHFHHFNSILPSCRPLVCLQWRHFLHALHICVFKLHPQRNSPMGLPIGSKA